MNDAYVPKHQNANTYLKKNLHTNHTCKTENECVKSTGDKSLFVIQEFCKIRTHCVILSTIINAYFLNDVAVRGARIS